MSLGDHLRELRNRLTIAAVAILIGGVVGWIYYDRILNALTAPLYDIAKQRHSGVVNINFSGMTDAFSIQINVSLFVGLLLASPVWLMQIWGFIVPGLTRKEKRVARLFIVAAVPLFIAGCAVAFFIVPRAVAVLLSFTPPGAYNLQQATDYLNFVLKFIVAFGLAFLLPVFMVALNLVNVLSAKNMVKAWRPAVMVIFVFAAVMTPTPDPWSMLVLAAPMVALYFSAVGVCTLLDRRKAKETPDWLDVPDDEASSL
ncbi:MAG: twin-arginine translocase subunit TatC [Humibacillus sp.]|nr:twin-arginine translocase subunit TatC [Humibacillus sp.]MDN5777886.1 twin-arginine translocase subunit TatC [Humibacillus sp.]